MESKIFFAVVLLLWVAAPILYFTFDSLAPERERDSGGAGPDKERQRRKAAFWQGAAVGGGYVLIGWAVLMGLQGDF